MTREGHKPSPKEVVELLMEKIRVEKRDVISCRTGITRRNVLFNIFRCPKGAECRESGAIAFGKGKGYTNPYSHLKRCISGGSEDHLIQVFQDAIGSQRCRLRSSFSTNHSPLAFVPNDKEAARYGYITLVVYMSLPVSHVASEQYRKFSRFTEKFSVRIFEETLFKLVELVEARIEEDIANTKGAIMHDGWTANGTHYLCVFGLFMRRVKVLIRGAVREKEELAIVLLSVSPISKSEDDYREGEASDLEATTFNAHAHVRQLEDVFHFFGVNVHEWAICQVADNCSVNKRIARLMEITHVSCNSHKLDLEVKRMIRSDDRLQNAIESVHNTMKDCKKPKNRAILRNLTDLAPVMHNETRWSGKYHMLKRFNRIRNEWSEHFRNRASLYEKQFKQINQVTLELQKLGASLSNCRLALDELIAAVEQCKYDVNSPFYRCHLGQHYIAADAAIVCDQAFVSGVIKIQRGESDIMTDEENDACKKLKLERDGNIVSTTSGSGDSEMSMEERIAMRKRKHAEVKQTYMNCDFVLGSTAEVERLWSVAKNILTDNRTKMTPLLLEALLFLKQNKGYWDQQLVSAAMNGARSARLINRVREDMAQEELS